MNSYAVPQAGLKARFIFVALAAAAMLLAALGGSASAASPVGKDGTIHACYRVKGKPKGNLRVVAAKARCKRGERKVVWSATGQNGQSGSSGQNGSSGSGQQGQAGTDGTPSPGEVALKTQVASLNLKIDGLEEVLGGLTKGDLLGAVNTVKGLNNTDLTETVDALPLVSSLCTQNEELAEQINLISGVVENLGLSSALEALGLLVIPTLPADLPPLGCGTP
ncbi:MAG TPA: hypothetical protein VH042_11685 [Solirubrobacterales bacterium]|nr:hypothetical protein [Solirubrobacterales bacterium]